MRKKNQLPFEEWIYRNGHRVRDHDHRIVLAITSKLLQYLKMKPNNSTHGLSLSLLDKGISNKSDEVKLF